ncbi:MAG: hypothetical protein GX178_11970 [Acidobacteria bacterium]|jgi:hypothetical protein|nr:hypothetical protein [Thermoanaerobaculia bacterium]NLN12304.1 hypothetical protein [Acidobacteriota bacterium]MBP7813057.1 hypothetical protein [Thermoanaerobaculia bacterium]MBP8845621.1 hypothetical protein [Thermoanaerobaculia bacterium]HNU83252.1 hypothetical protein [Thermoanaerobaculia bacterium]
MSTTTVEPAPAAATERLVRELQERGWEVSSRLRWVAVARRGVEVEEADGATCLEALVRLAEALRLEEGARLP